MWAHGDNAGLAKQARRRAFRLVYLNAALWAIGNALTTGTLVTYLALELGATGLALSLILAAPTVIGLLRFATPAVVDRLGSSKRASIALFLASYVLIWGLPAVGVPDLVPQPIALAALVALLSAHQLLEYMGQAALWQWLAGIVPPRIRGRFFGRRQMLQLAVVIPTLLVAAHFSDTWKAHYERVDPRLVLLAFAIPNSVGALFLLASIMPLAALPAVDVASRRESTPGEMFVALSDPRFRRLLVYGCWVSFFNGVTQAPQGIFPRRVLDLGVQSMTVMRIGMQAGQIGVSRVAGPFSDRFGNRPTLVASQAGLALAPAFFLLATPSAPYWIAGAWIAWSAYAGLNICLPNLMLKLAGTRGDEPDLEHSGAAHGGAYIAAYFALTSVFYAASTVAGGVLFDRLNAGWSPATGGTAAYRLAFGVALIARALAIGLAALLIEPGARRWREILSQRE